MEAPRDDEKLPNDSWEVPYAGVATYLIVGAIYVLIGMEVHFLLSWTRGFIVPFVGVWAIPYFYTKWRKR